MLRIKCQLRDVHSKKGGGLVEITRESFVAIASIISPLLALMICYGLVVENRVVKVVMLALPVLGLCTMIYILGKLHL